MSLKNNSAVLSKASQFELAEVSSTLPVSGIFFLLSVTLYQFVESIYQKQPSL